MAAGPRGVGQQGREPLDPAVDGDVVHLDAALGEQLLHVAGTTARSADTTARRARSRLAGSRTQRTQTVRQERGEIGEFSWRQSAHSGLDHSRCNSAPLDPYRVAGCGKRASGASTITPFTTSHSASDSSASRQGSRIPGKSRSDSVGERSNARVFTT
jgi:hypothetical protein